MGAGALIGKALFFVFVFMWVRWTLPRFRYDQLMNLGWTGLIPLSIYNVLVTGIGILSGQPIITGVVGIVVLLGGLVIYDQLKYKKKIA